ncbi:protein D-63 [Sulfurisphaera ohwakuensis]|uniref:protein D-63 n=1 Tax=Sulfurisphaera ohwakuensis TaxID=69656 RepID=UPI0036F3E044
MAELELGEIFEDLDTDIRDLLSTVHSIKIDMIIGDNEKAHKDLTKARWLIERITEELNEVRK